MLGQLRTPTKGFEYVIRQHFFLRRKHILDMCQEWIDASMTPASYSGLVADHNNDWCNKFRATPTAYKDMLTALVEELRMV